MTFSGAARSTGPLEVRSVELTVRSLRAGGAPLLQEAVALPEIILNANEPSPFQIDLPMEKTPARIDVLAVYRVTPDLTAPSTAAAQHSFTVEDACSPSLHPNPLYRP
jgi:hypothetical protein